MSLSKHQQARRGANAKLFDSADGILKEVFEGERDIMYLYGVVGEDEQHWLEQLDLLSKDSTIPPRLHLQYYSAG
jgi:hypothetical protein